MTSTLRIQKSTELSALSRLFSASIIKEMAKLGSSPLMLRLLEESGFISKIKGSSQVADIFDIAFNELRRVNNRHEYIYKSAITHKILLGVHSLNTASMINEFRVGANKADVVILNGTGSVYEIKSERDTLNRLENQISSYKEVFAKVHVITGENHVQSVAEIITDDVGILILSKRGTITTYKEAVDLPERTNPLAILDTIRVSEAKGILKDLGIPIPDVPNTRLYIELKDVYSKLSAIDVHCSMVRILKKTRSLIPLSSYVEDLPKSLIAAAFSTKFKRKDYFRLISALKTPVGDAMKWNRR